MRSKTIRIIILSFITVVVMLVCAQLFWLNKIYRFEVKSFRTNVLKSIKGLYNDLDLSGSSTAHLQNLTEQPDPNSFLFRVDKTPEQQVLKDQLYDKLEDFGILSDCKAAMYDVKQGRYIFELYLPATVRGNPNYTKTELQLYKREFSYIILNFPNRTKYILQSISWWIVSSTALLLVLVALGISIFYLYRQKTMNEIQNDFIRNVTHEFQTPLTTLTVGLDALNKDVIRNQPDKMDRYVKMMQGQTVYLNHHIQNLVRVLQTENGQLDVQKSEVSPEAIVEQVLGQMEVLIEEKQATVHCTFEAKGAKVRADASGLFLVIMNLISNALKYAPQPEIHIHTSIRRNKYILAVGDNGIGIDRKYFSRMFKKFYRVPTGNVHNVKGLGLGLYFSRKILDEHQGSIQVDSTPGQGSIFTIELPINK